MPGWPQISGLRPFPRPDLDFAGERLFKRAGERIVGIARRAEVVGIEPDRFAVGRGERDPLVPTADDVDEPKNRRVEINVR